MLGYACVAETQRHPETQSRTRRRLDAQRGDRRSDGRGLRRERSALLVRRGIRLHASVEGPDAERENFRALLGARWRVQQVRSADGIAENQMSGVYRVGQFRLRDRLNGVA